MAVNESESGRFKATPPGKEKHTSPIPGGRAEGVPDSSFDKKQLARGTKVEYEHTPDKAKAKDIAKDHLIERKDYYEKLEKMEKSASVEELQLAFYEQEKTAAALEAGFLDELTKIAEISAVELAKREHAMKSEQELMKTLQPGDLVFSAPHRNRGKGSFLGRRIFKPLSRVIQGTDYGHTAIYTGNGNIIDTRMERAAKEVSLHSLVAANNVVAARPKNVTPEEQKKAVEYARSQLGKRYSFGALVRAGTPFQGRFRRGGPENSNKLMCSGLAANAYANRRFANVSRKYIRPSQILSSQQVTPVAHLATSPQPV